MGLFGAFWGWGSGHFLHYPQKAPKSPMFPPPSGTIWDKLTCPSKMVGVGLNSMYGLCLMDNCVTYYRSFSYWKIEALLWEDENTLYKITPPLKKRGSIWTHFLLMMKAFKWADMYLEIREKWINKKLWQKYHHDDVIQGLFKITQPKLPNSNFAFLRF